MQDWIKNHFTTLCNLQLNTAVSETKGKFRTITEGFSFCVKEMKRLKENRGKIMFVGNGGSAGIASHLAIDYSKNGQIPALAFNDASAVTCLSNDYGYEHVFAKQIEFHGREEDLLIAISSSGKSQNIINAVHAAKKIGCGVVTFTGFEETNPLRELGDVNFYIAANEYGLVEVAHLGLGHAMLDYIMYEQSHAHQQMLAAV